MMGLSFKMMTLMSLLGASVVGGLVYVVWPNSEPLPELAPIPHLVQTRASRAIASELVIPDELRSDGIAVPPIPGDVRDALRRRLQSALESQHGVEVVLPEGAIEAPGRISETLQSLSDRWLPELLQSDRPPAVALVARVRESRDDDRAVLLDAQWSLESISATPRTLATGEAVSKIERSWFDADYARLTVLSWSRSWRFLGWLGLACLLPLIGIGISRRVLERESNLLNAVLLAAVALPGVFGAWFFTGFGAGFGGSLVTLVAASLACAFAYFFLSTLEEAR